MPNKTNTSRTRVSKSTSKGGFKFRWWMGALLIAVVAVIGIYVIYSSRASGKLYVGTVTYVNRGQGALTVNINGMGPVSFVQYPGNVLNGSVPGWSQNYLGWCAAVNRGSAKNSGSSIYDVQTGDKVFVSVFDGKDANSCYGEGATLN